MKFHVTRVEQHQMENGIPITFADLDVGYDEFLEIDRNLPGPRPGPTNKTRCSLFVRATRPNGSVADLVASVATSNQKLPCGLLAFYRRRPDEIPIGTEIELIGYENSPI
jgi:hypothetical protein